MRGDAAIKDLDNRITLRNGIIARLKRELKEETQIRNNQAEKIVELMAKNAFLEADNKNIAEGQEKICKLKDEVLELRDRIETQDFYSYTIRSLVRLLDKGQ